MAFYEFFCHQNDFKWPLLFSLWCTSGKGNKQENNNRFLRASTCLCTQEARQTICVFRCLNFLPFSNTFIYKKIKFLLQKIVEWHSQMEMFLSGFPSQTELLCPAETHTMSPHQLEHLSVWVCACVCAVQTIVPEPSAPLSICWSPPGWTKVTSLLSFTMDVDLCAHFTAHALVCKCLWECNRKRNC